MTDKVAADLSTVAASREITVAALVRQAIVRELYFRKDPLPGIHRHMIFVALAVDGLISRQPDPEFRARIIELWRQRIAEEESRHGD